MHACLFSASDCHACMHHHLAIRKRVSEQGWPTCVPSVCILAGMYAYSPTEQQLMACSIGMPVCMHTCMLPAIGLACLHAHLQMQSLHLNCPFPVRRAPFVSPAWLGLDATFAFKLSVPAAACTVCVLCMAWPGHTWGKRQVHGSGAKLLRSRAACTLLWLLCGLPAKFLCPKWGAKLLKLRAACTICIFCTVVLAKSRCPK